jgi:hypothetical protein
MILNHATNFKIKPTKLLNAVLFAARIFVLLDSRRRGNDGGMKSVPQHPRALIKHKAHQPCQPQRPEDREQREGVIFGFAF